MRLTNVGLKLVIAVSLMTLALASDQNYDKRFARVSYVDGNVVFRHGTDADWVAGSINTPLQEQDRLYVPLNSQSEVEFDDGSFLRLAEDSEVRLLGLDRNLIRLELAVGLATLRLGSSINFEIDTPSGTVRALQQGSYRIEVLRDGAVDLAVRKGTAELVRASESQRVRRNEAVTASVDMSAQVDYRPIDQEDAWDSFNDRRDAMVVASYSRRYLPGDVYIGVAELDHYGAWIDVGEYGHCWRPLYVSHGWSPYREGRWAYRPYWGWTWVSYEPWGWLPYHYGRWFYDPVYSWCWRPDSGFGLSVSFNFWSPGLVHFYRYGGGYHWLPVGPHDHYNIRNYYYNVNNIGYNTYIQNYNVRSAGEMRDRQVQNIGVSGAMISMADSSFAGGRPGERFSIPAAEVINRGNRIGSIRDIDIQPGVVGRSSRPDVDVRRLGFQDSPYERTASSGAGAIRPSVRTAIPSTSNESSVGSARDQSSDRPAGRRNLGGYSLTAPGVRVVPPREDANVSTGRVLSSTGARDRDIQREGNSEDSRNSRRVAPIVTPETGTYGTVRRRLPPRDGAEGTTPTPNQSTTQDQPRGDTRGVPESTSPTQDRDSQRRFIIRDSGNGNQSAVPASPEKAAGEPGNSRRIVTPEPRSNKPATTIAPSADGFRDREGGYSSTPEGPAPRVRVFTPERNVSQSGAPTIGSPSSRREEPAADRGWQSAGPTISSGMPARDRSTVSSPRSTTPQPPPSMRIPSERRPQEKKPDPPRN